MKAKISKILIILLATIMMFAVGSCSKEQEPTLQTFNLWYIADEGGTIEGKFSQRVMQGEDGTAVTALPNTGYEFVQWSDGVKTAERTDKNINDNLAVHAEFKKKIYTVKYVAGEHGRIDGDTEQRIEHGNAGTKVIAIADSKYEFINWSDGVKTAERTDFNLMENQSVTAYFTEYTRTFKLNYKFGNLTEDVQKLEEVTLTYDNLNETKFPVPTREHFTFGGWYIGENQLTDISGTVNADEEIIETDDTEIYAKWTANETFTYKILLVYVTRIDAKLPTRDETAIVDVNYTMSELEREFCELTTKRLKLYLDDMLDGLVDFEVDEYFTTKTIFSESFEQGGTGKGINNSLFPTKIEEVSSLIVNYDSVLTVFNMNDIDYRLHNASGAASAHYGEINFDSLYNTLRTYKSTLQTAVNALKKGSDIDLKSVGLPGTYLLNDYWFSVFTHELAHTIEQRVNLYSYHKTVVGELHGNQHYKSIIADKFYYLNEAVMEGNKVGIPYRFWKGEIAEVNYLNPYDGKGFVGGYLKCSRLGVVAIPIGSFNIRFDAIYGEVIEITAEPKNGYRFVEWSDGIITPTRTDIILGDLTVTAVFEKIE